LLLAARRYQVGDGFKEDRVKTSIRWWSRFALVAGMGLTTLVNCSSDRHDEKGDEQRVGSLALALQTTAASGSPID
jgi:hypothetical protein